MSKINGSAHLPEWLRNYVNRGFRLVFYDARTKGPKGLHAEDWQLQEYRPEDYKEGQNIGIVTGHEIEPGKFLVDVDFDWPEGLPLVKKLLPATGFGYGRPSRKLSHAFFTTPTPLPSKKYSDIDGQTLVELRGTKIDGTLGLQSMAPPSIHPSEEIVTLLQDGEIAHVEKLDRSVTLYAIACLLLRNLGPRGLLHDVRLSTAGFLLQLGFEFQEVVRLGESLATALGNDDSDIEPTVRTTAQRIKRGERVNGAGALAKAIGADKGKKVIAKIRDWMGQQVFITDEHDRIIANKEENIVQGLNRLGVKLSYNLFSQKAFVDYGDYKGVMIDEVRNRIWLDLDRNFRFKPSGDMFDIVWKDQAYVKRFHPVRTYLDSLKWDGTPRIDTWLTRYANAANNDYTNAVGAIVLIAAVRRVRKPGCKFDELLVFESDQGFGKSSALRALCPDDEWFSDDLPLNVDAKQLIEATAGKWIIEAAELSGMRKSQSESLKSMLSRQVDGPVRMAYARLPVEIPRQFIIIGTTNSHTYLNDITGNRRFWPVRVGKFDLRQLSHDRDQIWAEASHREAANESIRLKEELYKIAGMQQERRRFEDPWEQILDEAFALDEKHRLSPELIWGALNMNPDRRDERAQHRVTAILQKLGFKRATIRHEGKVIKGWARDPDGTVQGELLSDA
jgi:predicted P-loop ATPase